MQRDPLLATKLYIPPIRPELVSRPRLIERLGAGLDRKLTIISAPAGFGKTTLVIQWLKSAQCPSTWLSLDESDNDITRFLRYLVAALRALVLRDTEGTEANVGQGVLGALQSPQPPPAEAVLTTLINDIATFPDRSILVLDDYHLIEAQAVDDALSFLLEHLPQQMHLVIATREDPQLPLARLRAQGQLTELRISDLRFTSAEAAEFLNQAMGLDLSAEDIAALEARTEGWIAGLHLAALALQGVALQGLAEQGTFSRQGHRDTTSFIESFTGSHRYVLDYLVEEVLEQQSESVQAFLLRTSILDRLSGPLCDAVRFGVVETPSTAGQEILEYLERSNLFVVPLDNERRWYRYHHLFADLLRQRLHQSLAAYASDEGSGVSELHKRASIWYENHGLEIEAFQHAAAANDVEHAARLIEGKGTPGVQGMPGIQGMPLHYRGAVAPVLTWLESLPTTVLDARPSLWVMYASALVFSGQSTSAEPKLQAAEAAFAEAAAAKETARASAAAKAALPAHGQGTEPVATEALASAVEGPDDETKDLVGQIAALRAMVALRQRQIETIIAQAHRALEYLHPYNLPVRTATNWTLALAHQFQGDRAAARQAYAETISICQASGNVFINILASTGLGILQEEENELHLAAETYRRVLQLAGDPPQPSACEAHLGLARILYEWNDLDAAQQHGQQSVLLIRQLGSVETFAPYGVFLARLKLARGDVSGASAILTEADQFLRQHNHLHRMPEVAAAQVGVLLKQGDLASAADLAERHELPVSQARVHLASGDAGEALALLEPLRQQVEAKGRGDERLKVLVLQAIALHAAALQADGDVEKAIQRLGEALAMAEPGGFIRTFADEGAPMARLLREAFSRGIAPDYVQRLLVAFEDGTTDHEPQTTPLASSAAPSAGSGQALRPSSSSVEPLSKRELEVLELIAEGLTNPEIASRLFLSVHTVKVHAHNIYGKLDVHTRTEAVVRAQTLGLLPRYPR